MKRFVLSMLFTSLIALANPTSPRVVFAEEAEIQTQQLVGKIVSVNNDEFSFDMEFVSEEPSGQKSVSTFYVTEITTIDIAMTQANLSDLATGMNVLVEYANMPDGTRVVESVWVKN